jgi:DNA-binding CsgD family transcriptional regulator
MLTVISQDFLKAIATERGVSDAELEALSLAMEGQSTDAIAKQLRISGDAVRKRLSEVYQKFQIAGKGPVKLTKLQQVLMSRYQDHQTQTRSGTPPNLTGQTIENSNPRQVWSQAPDVSVFYGRTEELATLKEWILNDRCRLIALLGLSGIGKTALSVKLAKQIQDEFEVVVWRSLRQAPPVQDILAVLIRSLSNSQDTVLPETVEGRISWLIDYFRKHRCLVVLDGAESILQSGVLAGIYRDGYEGYGELLKRVGQEPHKSCLLLTSQEKLSEISLLEGETLPIRSFKLGGLGDAAKLLLKEKGLSGEKNWGELIRGYRGNPFMLKLAATTIKEVFDGSVTEFLAATLFTHDISDFVEELLERLSDLEKRILYQMALKKEPIILKELQHTLSEVSPQELIRGVASLRQRSLIERAEGGFTLPPVVMEVTTQLITSSEEA